MRMHVEFVTRHSCCTCAQLEFRAIFAHICFCNSELQKRHLVIICTSLVIILNGDLLYLSVVTDRVGLQGSDQGVHCSGGD